MHQIVLNHLQESGTLTLENGDITTYSIKVSDSNIVISGNKLGLILLADYIVDIALSTFNGSHIHLDELYFFDEMDKELIIELNDEKLA